MKLTPKIILSLILCVFLLISVFFAFSDNVMWWDSAVYIGIGKYLWSAGESGFIEEARPLLLPFLIGFFWKIGIDPTIIAQVLSLLFSVGVLVMVYMLGKYLFDEQIALLASAFLAFSPTFVSLSYRPLTEIPSAFFLLMGLWFFFSNKYPFAGIFFGLSFITRFYQAFFIVLFMVAFFLALKKRKEFFLVGHGFLAIIFPYLLLNGILFGNPMQPFIMQYYLSSHTGIIYDQPAFFYLVGLFKENFFSVALLALPFYRRSSLSFLTISALLTFLLYSLFDHKEMRLIMVVLPLLYLLISFVLFEIVKSLPVRYKRVSFTLLGTLVVLLGILSASSLLVDRTELSSQVKYFQEYMHIHEEHTFWISNPLFALHSDASVVGLMYYPGAFELPQIALTNSCDYLGNDEEYTRSVLQSVHRAEQLMATTYISEENGCLYRIFEKIR